MASTDVSKKMYNKADNNLSSHHSQEYLHHVTDDKIKFPHSSLAERTEI